MHHPTTAELAQLLPGAWGIAATNLPLWLDGQRSSPRLAFDLVAAEPLRLTDDTSFTTPDGEERHLLGRSRGGEDGFVRRARGLAAVTRRRWDVTGADEERQLLVVRYAGSPRRTAGIDLLVREGASTDGIRSYVAARTEALGLSPEDFGSLTWLARG